LAARRSFQSTRVRPAGWSHAAGESPHRCRRWLI